MRYKFWLSFAGEAMGSRSTNISSLGQNLTLATYTGGPRITFRHRHSVIFGQTMFGLAHGSDSYFPTATSYTTSATSYALAAGGGVDVQFTHRLALRPIEAQLLHTAFNNGVNNSQNHLLLGSGVVLNLHGEYAMPHSAFRGDEQSVTLNCAADTTSVQAGQNVEVSGLATVTPESSTVSFAWTSSGGRVTPVNSAAEIETAGLAPGRYHVTGHASLDGAPKITGDCKVSFQVLEPPAPAPLPPLGTLPMVMPPATAAPVEAEFHANVADAYFDYDKADLRPDTEESLVAAAAYLKTHPELHVLVGGYSDERGTDEYNVALGAKRSAAARDELVRLGVDASRITTASYGKGVQVCTTPTEPCFQRNRRAAFELLRTQP